MVQWFRVVQNGSDELWFRSSVVQPPYRGANRLNHSLEPGRAGWSHRIESRAYWPDAGLPHRCSLGCSTLHRLNGFAWLTSSHSLHLSLHRCWLPTFVAFWQRRLIDQ